MKDIKLALNEIQNLVHYCNDGIVLATCLSTLKSVALNLKGACPKECGLIVEPNHAIPITSGKKKYGKIARKHNRAGTK